MSKGNIVRMGTIILKSRGRWGQAEELSKVRSIPEAVRGRGPSVGLYFGNF
jgi:hypothetical protein